MLNSLRVVAASAILLLMAIAGCQQPKEPPTITFVTGNTSIEARDSMDYTCYADDQNPAQLSYSWSQEGGQLGWNWGRYVRWFAPESSGRGIIRVVVTNADGLSASESLALTVRAETAGVLFWDGAVKAGHYQEWSDSLLYSYELYGYCGSDSGRLTLMVMDDSNFNKWVAGQPSVPLLRDTPPSQGHAFSVHIGPIGLCHIIIDNIKGARDCNYWLYVWKAGR